MIKVENKYDFTVEELTDILSNTPIKVDHDTNYVVAEYIIQALNINKIIKDYKNPPRSFRDIKRCLENSGCEKKTVDIDRPVDRGSPYHLIITKNQDNSKLFECDARSIAFYAYDPLLGKPHKAILTEKKPTPTDIANVCEYLGDINGWGTFQ